LCFFYSNNKKAAGIPAPAYQKKSMLGKALITTLGSIILFAGSCESGPPMQSRIAAQGTGRGMVNMEQKAREALSFCTKHKYDTGHCILIDMSVHSGKERIVIWDFNGDSVLYKGAVSHGCGDLPWGKDGSKDAPVFSNEHNSHCSSLGKYRVGERGASQWGIGIKYLLHGLDASNRNALQREIVFHSWDAVADRDVYPEGTPEGWGCPAVSDRFMRLADDLLDKKTKPVLLWIYK
jgi:hypothetical protein